MDMKRIRFFIESDIHQVPLVGMAVSRLTESLLAGRVDPFQVELCTVEAVTNSIEHACGAESQQEVEVIYTLTDQALTIDICDEGKALDPAILQSKGSECFHVDPQNLECLPEGGRGLAIIKEIMDEVSCSTRKGKNCLTLVKRLDQKTKTG